MDPNLSAPPDSPRPGTLAETPGALEEPGTPALIARINQLSRTAFHLRESEEWNDMLAMAEEARALAESI